MALLGLITIVFISLQISIKSTSVQAQTTANPTVKPVLWQDSGILGAPLYPDAASGCEAYRKAFIDGSLNYAVLIPPIEPVYSPTATTTGGAGAGCHFTIGITSLGQYTDSFRRVDAVCRDAPDGSTYSYTGGLNGVCVLSSSSQTSNANTQKGLTQDQKNALHEIRTELKKVAVVTTIVSKICLIPPIIPITYKLACTAIFQTLSIVMKLFSWGLLLVALDPPDSNYTVVYQPVFPSLPDSQIQAGLTPAEINAFNPLIQNQLQAIGFANAAYISYNRASGAINAGDSNWEQKQLETAKKYVQQLANLLDAEPALLTNLVNTLKSSGFPTVTITAKDISDYISSVNSNGLPDFVVTGLKQLGADNNTIEEIRLFDTIQDINSTQIIYPQDLANQSLLNSLHQAAQKLR